MKNTDNFEGLRRALNSYMKRMADELRVPIDAVPRDADLAVHLGRYYEESSSLRAFNICKGGPAPVDAFTKSLGIDNDQELLQVDVELHLGLFPLLWELRVAWLVGGCSESDIQQLIAQAVRSSLQ